MTESSSKLRSVFLVAMLVFAAVAGATLGGVGAAAAAVNQGADLSCVGGPGGAAYVTDSGLTAYENDSEVYYGTFGADGNSVTFGDVTLSAAGQATVRVEDATGDRTCIGNVTATQNNVTVEPSGESGLTVAGEYAGLAFRDPVFDESGHGETDIAYNATDPASVTVTDTGLAEGETLVVVETATDSRLGTAAVGADGAATFAGLPSGTSHLDLRPGAANFTVAITATNAPVTEGQTLSVTATVENIGDISGTQQVTLGSFDGTQVDRQSVSLPAGSTTDLTLTWQTTVGDAGSGTVTVASANETATQSVQLTEANDAPSAADESYEVTEGETLSLSEVGGVLANDDDADGDALSASVVAGVADGDLTLDSDGSFVYTPNEGFTGEDSFSYEVSDGNGGTDQATATITVTEAPDPPAFTVAITGTNAPVTEGETLSVTAIVENVGETSGTQQVTLADFDGTQVASQSLSLDAASSATVTLDWPTDASDVGSGAVTVASENDTATQAVSVDPSNDSPSAADESYDMTDGERLSVSESEGVLANDDDPDGDALSASVVAGVADGDLTLDSDGSFVYTPREGFTGDDSFSYEARDGNGGTDQATVSITVTERTLQPAEFGVNITGTNDPITAGETLSVTAIVENVGETSGTQQITLADFDGTQVDRQSVSLAPGGTTEVTLEWLTDTGAASSGSITLRTANNTAVRSVTVAEAENDGGSGGDGGEDGDDGDGSDDSAEVTVRSVNISQATVGVGETVSVTAVIASDGVRLANRTIALQVDDERVRSETVSLPAEGNRTVAFTYTFSDPGEYALSLGDMSFGPVTVEAEETTDDSDEPADTADGGTATSPGSSPNEQNTDGSGPGFGVLAAAVAVLAAALLALRRH